MFQYINININILKHAMGETDQLQGNNETCRSIMKHVDP